MATVGNSSTPATTGWWYGVNTNNAAWSVYTMPSPGGFITSISAYFDVDTAGPATCYVCIWNGSTGALLASAAVTGVPNGSQSTGGQAWHTASLGTPLYVASGASIAIGFWCPQANGFTTTSESGGSSFSGVQSGSGPGTASGPSTGHGALGAYSTYTPGGASYVNTGTPAAPVWTPAQVYVNTGTPAAPVWTLATAYVNTGTPAAPVWTPTG